MTATIRPKPRGAVNWINVRDPLYFLVSGVPYIYVKKDPFFPRVMWAKLRSLT